MQDIGYPPGAFVAGVSGINNAGTVVGGYIRASDFTPRSYIGCSLSGTAWTRWVNVESIGKPRADLDVKHIVSPPA